MKILFDTNILLDVLLEREPWAKNGYKLWQANDTGLLSGFVTATTITDIFYVTRNQANKNAALEAVITCLDAFEIIAVARESLESAVSLSGTDFEDNLQIACAALAGLDGIVTRNPTDFSHATITIFPPEKLVEKLKNIH